MIRYTIKCANDHAFESWFQSAEAFDTLQSAGHVSCPACGITDVSKSLMAPTVRPARKPSGPAPTTPDAVPQPMVNTLDPEVAQAIAKIKEHVEQTSDYVGSQFAKEARAMHEGEAPKRAIYGEARADEAKKLIEDGVPAVPLPFTPKQKTN